ncbi:MAG: hypothetical protein IJT23_03210 [Clostridia bacterium]|nr:hypothetical protein [Clostridia bacterium]
MKILSKNFELRYISTDKNANGETDFKGETSTLSTNDRVEFLNEYAKQFPNYIDDFSLDTPIVSLDEARKELKKIKSQPQPTIRARKKLDNWKWIGYVDKKDRAKGFKIPHQDFRCFMEWEINENVILFACKFAVGTASELGFDDDGRPYYITDRKRTEIIPKGKIRKIKMELDFVYRKWNLYLNDELVADFVPFSNPDTEAAEII